MLPSVLILGSTSDMARALARLLASKGHPLLLAARNGEAIEADAQDLRVRFNATVSTHLLDAADIAAHESWYAALPQRPDWVISAIGYLGKQQEQEKNWAAAHQTILANYTGVVSLLHHAANDMEARGSGMIVGISSVAGERGRASNYYYGSAKAGFTAFLSGLRNRLAKKGVHVLTVKPGFVDTNMTDGLDLPPLLTAQPDAVAKDILKAIHKQKNVLYTKWMWKYIMLIIRNIPEGLFKKLSL
ncbi:MAG: SDR family oxidoreductase [Bacteroidia bacterium]|nr:SDR family oxidoreductase [Bacteroidia bacterium]